MIQTGIPKLDEYIKGIPEGKSLLFYIEPGVEESNIGIHILHHNLERGLYGIYISSETSPRNIERIFDEFNWNFKKYDKLIIIDGYSPLIGTPAYGKYVVEEPHDIESYEDLILQIFEEIDGKGIIVFDSLSNIMDLCGERKTLEGIERINKKMKKFASVYNFIAWPYKENILYKIKRMFDTIVEIKTVENDITLQRMEIKKLGWEGKKDGKLLFKIFKPEGIRIYIPKISVIGNLNAGKTTFIKAISKKFISAERLGTTVGIEHGIVDYKGYRAEIFGMPEEERFSMLAEKFGKSSKGIFLVIDSTKPEEFENAKRMVEKFKDIPIVIVANKQDLEGALKKEEIKQRLKLDAEIVETVAKEGKGVFEAFEKLVSKILEGKC